ncbi:hypothetical protein JCM8547_005423 [Rhodosporidiobolus lusitaniae]
MPSNANELEGPCCVSGAPTTQRCGVCQEAGFDLFFCSREHQKWVWFPHKTYCGKNGRPFRFPLFPKEEVDYAVSIAEVPTRSTLGMRSIVDSLRGSSDETLEEIIDYIRMLSFGDNSSTNAAF